MIYFYLILAVFLTQLINIFFIKNHFFTVIPLIIIQAYCFFLYFKNGSIIHSYGFLILLSMSLTIITSFVISYFYFQKPIQNIDYFSIGFILVGIAIYIYSKF